MSIITHIEKQKLERELRMQGGWVLNFSNRTFEEFFREVVGVQIYDSRYDRGSGSKANRLRAFWDVATEKQLQLFFSGLLEGWSIYAETPISSSAQSLLQQILNRFGGASPKVESQQTNSPTAGISGDDAKKLASQLSVCEI